MVARPSEELTVIEIQDGGEFVLVCTTLTPEQACDVLNEERHDERTWQPALDSFWARPIVACPVWVGRWHVACELSE
jgi:hypothetical protein